MIKPPVINKESRVPPSRQVADWLRARIMAGEFNPPGERRLPSEFELTQQFPLSRETIRKSYKILRDEGLIETLQTRGSYTLEWHGEDKPRRR